MRFSVFTVSLPEWTPEEAVEHLAALGYDGIEWRVIDQPPHDGPPGFWSGNRCTLAAAHACAPTRRASVRSARAPASRYRTSARTCRASIPMPSTARSPVRPRSVRRASASRSRTTTGSEPYLPLRDAALRRVRRRRRLAARHGVRALVETHMGTIVPSASAAAQFCSRLRPCARGRDPRRRATWCSRGSSATAWGSRCSARTSRTSTSRTRAGRRRAPGRTARVRWAAAFAPLAEGSVDVRDLLACAAGGRLRRLDLVRGLLDRPPAAGADPHQPRIAVRALLAADRLTRILGRGRRIRRPEPL